MSDPKPQATPRHPIGVVASRTGLPQDVIRAWERRYEAVCPGRCGAGRRLYSDEDIERLRLLRQAVRGGRRISAVAPMGVEDLRRLVAEDRDAESGSGADRGPPADSGVPAGVLLEEAVAALEALDRRRLDSIFNEASVALSGPSLRHDLIAPLLDIVGERWQNGSLRIVHEHLASTIVRSFIMAGRNTPVDAPRLIVTTPSGQQHELGALMAAAVAEEVGWDVHYLGPNLPCEEIAAAARQLGGKAIALSVSLRDGEGRALEEIRRLRRLVDTAVPIFVGGRAVSCLRERLLEAGARCPSDLGEFRAELLVALE